MLLLLFMQQDANLHALQHDGKWFEHAHEQGVQVPALASQCMQCALFAAGANVLTSSRYVSTPDATTAWHVTFAFTSQPAPQAHFYSSRAPPSVA